MESKYNMTIFGANRCAFCDVGPVPRRDTVSKTKIVKSANGFVIAYPEIWHRYCFQHKSKGKIILSPLYRLLYEENAK